MAAQQREEPVEPTMVPLTVDEAERLSTRIGLKLEAITNAWSSAVPLIREAIERDAYKALGYASHSAYVADRFGNALAELGVEMRREVVRELSEAGLSSRALAPVFAVSQKTIVKDRAQVSTPVSPDDPAGDVNGAVRPVERPESASAVDVHPSEKAAPAAPLARVTGIDGKRYEAKPKPKRRPLAETVRTAGEDLARVTEALARIAADDRFAGERDAIVSALRPRLERLATVATALIRDGAE